MTHLSNSDKEIRIAVATGTRADWGLLYPLVCELTERGHRPLIIATYAHLFPEMGDTIQELVADGFAPTMSVPTRRAPHEAVADAVTGFSKALRFLKPDILVILGDRLEMLGVATAALLERVPTAHIAGGTVSRGAFDDSIRNSISQMAHLHFPETEKGRRKLVLMGADPSKVVTAGALGVYNTRHTLEMSLEEIEKFIEFKLGEKYILGTFHPATLSETGPIEQMKIWLDGLRLVLANHPEVKLLLTFPNTDNDATPLLNLIFGFEAENRERVKVMASLGRVRYINAARHAAAVAGNSSSGIVEIPSLGVPVVDVGSRQEGRERSGAIIHSPLEAEAIATALATAMTPETREAAETLPNPYYKEDTPKIIADRLLSTTFNKK